MEKDFDTWNARKKVLNERQDTKSYHAREVWWASLGTNVGHEQDGTGKAFDRPVLVLKDFNRHICLIIPLSTSRKRNRYYIDVGMVGKYRAAAIISQLRLIDTRRITEKICALSDEKFQEIRRAVRSLI